MATFVRSIHAKGTVHGAGCEIKSVYLSGLRSDYAAVEIGVVMNPFRVANARGSTVMQGHEESGNFLVQMLPVASGWLIEGIDRV